MGLADKVGSLLVSIGYRMRGLQVPPDTFVARRGTGPYHISEVRAKLGRGDRDIGLLERLGILHTENGWSYDRDQVDRLAERYHAELRGGRDFLAILQEFADKAGQFYTEHTTMQILEKDSVRLGQDSTDGILHAFAIPSLGQAEICHPVHEVVSNFNGRRAAPEEDRHYPVGVVALCTVQYAANILRASLFTVCAPVNEGYIKGWRSGDVSYVSQELMGLIAYKELGLDQVVRDFIKMQESAAKLLARSVKQFCS